MPSAPFIAVCALLLGSAATAQQPDQPPPAKVRYEDLPPAVRLGVRVEALQKAWAVSPVIVIVPDGASYAAAIGHWAPPGPGFVGRRFPVLIDDGSATALEDIARFVRGFGPTSIVRWSSGEPLPQDARAKRKVIERALIHAWGAKDPDKPEAANDDPAAIAMTIVKTAEAPRSGIVIAADNDPAWPAALALAAGRVQPLAWVDRPPPGRLDTIISVPDFRKFETAIEAACESTHLPWKVIGDDIDTITLCMASPNRVQAEPNLILAMTDCIGRPLADEKERTGKEERWAWAGQIFGTESHTAYMAMSSLFLSPKKAWLFDSYPKTPPWSTFDATAAGEPLKKVGLETLIDETPRTGERDWRTRAAKPVDAGFIAVNTKGLSNEINLEPGRCLPADVPILNTPAMLYFVHSWSAFSPTEHWTVGGRWMDRGVYAYLGSVDEPYLQAFLPTPGVTARMASKLPFAPAVRFDSGPGWKLTVIGDPLTMIPNLLQRTDDNPTLDKATPLKDELHDALAAKDYAKTVRTLVLLGRDSDAAVLAKGLLKEDPKSLSPAAAEAAILPLFRQGDHDTMMAVYATLPSTAATSPALQDALWLAAYRILPTTRDGKVLGALRTAIRDDSRVRDALDLAEPWQRVFGHDAAVGLLEETKSKIKDAGEQARLDQEVRRLSGIRNHSR